MRFVVLLFFISFSTLIFAQNEEKVKDFDKKILFILDGSGSMKEQWLGESKWDIAINTLAKLIDSVQNINGEYQLAIRVLGHQFPRSMHRCDDTRLEIPFGANHTFSSIYSQLSQYQPQGYTPLALSMQESEHDFGESALSQNTIILITDGLENCDGDPCEVSQTLKKNNIIINPYIIGLGIDSMKSQSLNCIGTFVNATDKRVFEKVITNIIDEVTTRTTLKVNFYGKDSALLSHYLPYSLIDKRSKKEFYNFIYTPTSTFRKDTIFINPQYRYNLVLHSFPPLEIDTLDINIGQHNEWDIYLPTGSIAVNKPYSYSYKYMLSDEPMNQIGYVNTKSKYTVLAEKNYNADRIVLPIPKTDIFSINENKTRLLNYQPRGHLMLKSIPNAQITIFTDKWEKVMDVKAGELHNIEMDIGKYHILFKRENEKSDESLVYNIAIVENQKVHLDLE